MDSDNNIINSQKKFWLGRLGGIIITKFRQLTIEVDCTNYTISLWESGYSATVQIFEDGHLEWYKFDDADTCYSKIAYKNGEKFYKPIIKKIEGIYYSSEYEGVGESEKFMSCLEKGKFSNKWILFNSFIKLLIFIAAIIGWCFLRWW